MVFNIKLKSGKEETYYINQTMWQTQRDWYLDMENAFRAQLVELNNNLPKKMLESNIKINIADIRQLKALYSMSQEDMMILLNNNQNLFKCTCPDICEINRVLKEILK